MILVIILRAAAFNLCHQFTSCINVFTRGGRWCRSIVVFCNHLAATKNVHGRCGAFKGLFYSEPIRGFGFEEAQEIFERPYYLDQRSDMPEQYRAIGWVRQKLYALIFEIREDEDGEYYHLVTLWKATTEEQQLYEEHS